MKPETLALVSAVVAFVSALGSVASALVSYYNGKRQQASAHETARLSLVMPMREEWIAKLRDKVAWLIATCARVHGKDKFAADVDERVAVTLTEIGLMVNIAEPEQAELMESLKAMTNAVNTKGEEEVFNKIGKRAVDAARVVLRSEWERVKKVK
jgi:hypothetical protein